MANPLGQRYTAVDKELLLSYVESILRVYNLHGRRDNLNKARIKILVKAEGQRFIDDVEAVAAAGRSAERRRLDASGRDDGDQRARGSVL